MPKPISKDNFDISEIDYNMGSLFLLRIHNLFEACGNFIIRDMYQQAFESLLYCYTELAPLVKNEDRRKGYEQQLSDTETLIQRYLNMKHSPKKRIEARNALLSFKVQLGFLLDEKKMLIKTMKKRTLGDIEREMGI